MSDNFLLDNYRCSILRQLAHRMLPRSLEITRSSSSLTFLSHRSLCFSFSSLFFAFSFQSLYALVADRKKFSFHDEIPVGKCYQDSSELSH